MSSWHAAKDGTQVGRPVCGDQASAAVLAAGGAGAAGSGGESVHSTATNQLMRDVVLAVRGFWGYLCDYSSSSKKEG